MREAESSTVVWNDGSIGACVWACVSMCVEVTAGAVCSIVKRTIGVKLG